ncbi:hypothetical protein ACFL56_02255, partial [Candidatus Margulisiibacteriota bacterium]
MKKIIYYKTQKRTPHIPRITTSGKNRLIIRYENHAIALNRHLRNFLMERDEITLEWDNENIYIKDDINNTFSINKNEIIRKGKKTSLANYYEGKQNYIRPLKLNYANEIILNYVTYKMNKWIQHQLIKEDNIVGDTDTYQYYLISEIQPDGNVHYYIHIEDSENKNKTIAELFIDNTMSPINISPTKNKVYNFLDILFKQKENLTDEIKMFITKYLHKKEKYYMYYIPYHNRKIFLNT